MSRSTSIASGRAPPRADSGEMAHQKKLAAIAAGFNILSVSNCHGTRPLQTLEQQQEVESTQVAAESSGVPPSPGCTTFEQLWCELHDTMVPIRGHAFIQLRRMLLEGRAEVWQHRDQLLEACHSAIQDEDSYVYLSAIQALAVLVDRDSDHLLPWLAEQLSLEKLSVEARLNLGEVLLRVTKNFVPITQEILACLRGLIRDPADLVCHAAVLALGCIIKGMGQKIFKVMPHEVKVIYRELKHLYATTSDSVTKIQAQVAIEELSAATQELLRSQPRMEKRIQILDLYNASGS
ncbi:hypothetical protein V5799_011790 [Amblyomma americanum]|uniref:Uncharacterized protein n=1 Tax=Amblyomma americanum TaxID=6943 RepID=A0AAQ4EFW0_AMBAM